MILLNKAKVGIFMIQLNLTDERYEEMKHLSLEEVAKRIELENCNKADPLLLF